MLANEPVRVIVFKEGEQWVAQCLEHDIGAQAENLDKLNVILKATLKAELSESMARHGSPFAGIPPAPDHFQAMWSRRSNVFEARDPNCGIELALVA